PVASRCAWEPRVTQPETFVEGRREILRQASVALGGGPVTVWEVSVRAELEPQASSEPAPTHHATNLDVDATLRRWNIAIVQGSARRPAARNGVARALDRGRRRPATGAARRARPGSGGHRPLGELPAGRQGPGAWRAGAVGAVRRRARGPLLLHAREPRPQGK